MFLAGGMVRSQVATAPTGTSPCGAELGEARILAPPVDKRYTCRQFCRILIINMLKSALPMEKICGLLSYINCNPWMTSRMTPSMTPNCISHFCSWLPPTMGRSSTVND